MKRLLRSSFLSLSHSSTLLRENCQSCRKKWGTQDSRSSAIRPWLTCLSLLALPWHQECGCMYLHSQCCFLLIFEAVVPHLSSSTSRCLHSKVIHSLCSFHSKMAHRPCPQISSNRETERTDPWDSLRFSSLVVTESQSLLLLCNRNAAGTTSSSCMMTISDVDLAFLRSLPHLRI